MDEFLTLLSKLYNVEFTYSMTYGYASDTQIIHVSLEDNEFWQYIVLHEVGHALNHKKSAYHMQDEVLAWNKAEDIAKELSLPWGTEVEEFKKQCLLSYSVCFKDGRWRYFGRRNNPYHPAPVSCTWLKWFLR